MASLACARSAATFSTRSRCAMDAAVPPARAYSLPGMWLNLSVYVDWTVNMLKRPATASISQNARVVSRRRTMFCLL